MCSLLMCVLCAVLEPGRGRTLCVHYSCVCCVQYSSLGAGVDGVEASVREASLGSLRLENLELRRKLDDLETEKSKLQQKHLVEVTPLFDIITRFTPELNSCKFFATY